MSTRCYFGIMRESGEIALHYCHHDGYPTGVGRYLLDKANTAEAVRELMAKGDCSAIDDPEGYDEPESHEPRIFPNTWKLGGVMRTPGATDIEYVYIFDEKAGKWYYTSVHFLEEWGGMVSLSEVLSGEPAINFSLDTNAALKDVDFSDMEKWREVQAMLQDLRCVARMLKLARERMRYCEPCEQKESGKRLFVDSLERQKYDLSRELEKLAGVRVTPFAVDTVEL